MTTDCPECKVPREVDRCAQESPSKPQLPESATRSGEKPAPQQPTMDYLLKWQAEVSIAGVKPKEPKTHGPRLSRPAASPVPPAQATHPQEPRKKDKVKEVKDVREARDVKDSVTEEEKLDETKPPKDHRKREDRKVSPRDEARAREAREEHRKWLIATNAKSLEVHPFEKGKEEEEQEPLPKKAGPPPCPRPKVLTDAPEKLHQIVNIYRWRGRTHKVQEPPSPNQEAGKAQGAQEEVRQERVQRKRTREEASHIMARANYMAQMGNRKLVRGLLRCWYRTTGDAVMSRRAKLEEARAAAEAAAAAAAAARAAAATAAAAAAAALEAEATAAKAEEAACEDMPRKRRGSKEPKHLRPWDVHDGNNKAELLLRHMNFVRRDSGVEGAELALWADGVQPPSAPLPGPKRPRPKVVEKARKKEKAEKEKELLEEPERERRPLLEDAYRPLLPSLAKHLPVAARTTPSSIPANAVGSEVGALLLPPLAAPGLSATARKDHGLLIKSWRATYATQGAESSEGQKKRGDTSCGLPQLKPKDHRDIVRV